MFHTFKNSTFKSILLFKNNYYFNFLIMIVMRDCLWKAQNYSFKKNLRRSFFYITDLLK